MVAWRFVILFLVGLVLLVVMIALITGHMLNPWLPYSYNETERLVRYYACNVAICAKGCGSDMVMNRICLERNSVTQECDRWCQDICNNPPQEWKGSRPTSNPGDLCGEENGRPKYPIYISLKGRAPLKGCHHADPELPADYIVAGHTTGLLEMWQWIRQKEPNFPTTKDILSDEKFTNPICGISGDIYTEEMEHKFLNDVGHLFGGDIYLDTQESTELFGCYYDTVCAPIMGVEFGQCIFGGNLKIWSILTFDPDYNKNCVDVRINSSIVYLPFFDMSVSPSSPQKLPIGKTVEYTITVDNYLGTDTKFTIEQDSSICKISEPKLFVKDEDSNSTKMNCTPTEKKEYTIKITAKPALDYLPQEKTVILTGTDFELSVCVQGTDCTKRAIINKDELAVFDVKVTNYLGEQHNFDLTYTCKKSDGSDCGSVVTCDLGTNPLPVDDKAFATSALTCTPHDDGNYGITIDTTADDVTKTDTVSVSTVICDGEIKLDTIPALQSGNSFTVQAGVYKNGIPAQSVCDGLPVHFSLNDKNIQVQQCILSGGLCSSQLIANTPGSHKMYALIDKNGQNGYNDPGETDELSFTITALSDEVNLPIPKPCDANSCCYNTEGAWCKNWFSGSWASICETCSGGGLTWNPVPCTSYLDPQKSGGYQPSSVCCVNDATYYSNGPDSTNGKSSVPCLSADTFKHNEKTTDISYLGVTNPRDIFVEDNHKAVFSGNSYCISNDQCRILGDSILDDATCYKSSPTASGQCSLGTGYYNSWEFIRISDTSRSIYGLRIDYNINIAPYTSTGYLHAFIHSNNKWKSLGYWSDSGTKILKPDSGWAWDNVDAVLIGYGHPTLSGSAEVDYIGLLNKGDVPYCTEKPAGTTEDYYYGVVDDGKKCYWSVGCPVSGTGWTMKTQYPDGTAISNNPSLNVGAVGECSCGTGDCGRGYCKKSLDGTKFACYSGVTCANGGWRYQNLRVCDSSVQTEDECTSQGCS